MKVKVAKKKKKTLNIYIMIIQQSEVPYDSNFFNFNNFDLRCRVKIFLIFNLSI